MRTCLGFTIIVGAVLLVGTRVVAKPQAGEGERLNVLFIAADDLRPELGCYGASHIRSPQIDRLASRGVVFERAYCQQAVCNPSRASLMAGLRPDTLRVWDLETNLRAHQPDLVTLPQHFMAHGYRAERIGKIYHVGHGNHDDAPSWTAMKDWQLKPRFGPKGQQVIAQLRAEARRRGDRDARIRGLPWEAPDVADNELADGSIADGAIELMREMAGGDQPFFLAVGFKNPHLPLVSPKRYWDLYEASTIPIPDKADPKHIPPMSLTSWGELRAYVGIPPRGDLTDAQARQMIHGYYAAVSYVDAQVGRLLDELDRLKLSDRTIVILWGDHGWKLGEYGDWCKHTNMELDTRVPLIVAAPGMQAPGAKSRALVEFVDIYPSLCELAGLPIRPELEGVSFAPLLDEPGRTWKTAAFSQYPRGKLMGYSMRTERYHLVRWVNRGDRDGEAVALELYDHAKDPGETVNVAGDAAYAQTVAELTKQMRAGPGGARPKGR